MLLNIIAFNNSLFSVIPQLIDDSHKNLSGSRLLGSLYHDVPQDCPPGRDGGHVRIEFIGDEDLSFTDLALARIPPLIEHLHDQGYSGSDIGILVRSNREGALVLKTLIDYRAAAEPAKAGGIQL